MLIEVRVRLTLVDLIKPWLRTQLGPFFDIYQQHTTTQQTKGVWKVCKLYALSILLLLSNNLYNHIRKFNFIRKL